MIDRNADFQESGAGPSIETMNFLRSRQRQQQPGPAAPVVDAAVFSEQAESLIPAEVRMISGCHTEQTSADVSNVTSVGGGLPQPAGRAGGACTSALLSLLYEKEAAHMGLSFQTLLLELREKLDKNGFDQIPQLTSSRPLELRSTPFSLVGGNGIRRALLVGINYTGQNGELSGCQNDVLNMKKYLIERQGYQADQILVLMDDGRHHYPTRENIIRALQQFVKQSVAGDSVYFHYSGHGGLLSPEWNAFKQSNKDYDETLFPIDHDKAGQIRDFSLFNHFVKPMAAGVTVTCVMDCCHSGSVLDLPYSFQPTSSGEIYAREDMDSLSNLAMLYTMAGGILPEGDLFSNVVNYLEAKTDGNLDDFQGVAVEELTTDTEDLGWKPDGSDDNDDSFGEYNGNGIGDYGNQEAPYGVAEVDASEPDDYDGGAIYDDDGFVDIYDDDEDGGFDESDCGCLLDILGLLRNL